MPASKKSGKQAAENQLFRDAVREVQGEWGKNALELLGPRLYRAVLVEKIAGVAVRFAGLAEAETFKQIVVDGFRFATDETESKEES